MSDSKNTAPVSGPGSGPRRGGSPGMGPMGGNMRIESAKDARRAFALLAGLLQDKGGLLFIAILAMIASVIPGVVAPTMIANAIKLDLEQAQRLPEFMSEMLIVLVIYLAGWVVSVLSGWLMNIVAMVIVTRIRSRAFAHVQTLSMGTFDKRGIGDMQSRMTNDVEMIFNAMMQGVNNLVSGLFSMIGVLVAMFLLSVPLSLAVLAVVPLMALVTGVIGKRIRNAYKKNQEWTGRLTGLIEESVSGIKVIKAFRREDAEFVRFDGVNAKSRDVGVEAEMISYAFMPVMSVMTSLTLALVVGIGGWLALGPGAGVSVGLLSGFIMYARNFFQPLSQITQVYSVIQSALAGTERIFELFETPPEVLERADARPLADIKGAVSFENVAFAYEAGKPVLDGISFDSLPGQMIAIVGPTGAGKTTIINLLSRFYETKGGRILVDGQDIREVRLDDLRTRMGVVLQEPFFFATTIRENLLYARLDASEAEMVAAAKTANAHYFVSRLPDGYDTVLTERGENLSQGERQLLGIARAILADPRILILDEATSSVDSLTEAHIQEGLLRLMQGRTSFIIAHRLSTIRNASKVLVLHNHKIIESGTHDELMQVPGGFYQKLYSLQDEKPEVCEDDFTAEGCVEASTD